MAAESKKPDAKVATPIVDAPAPAMRSPVATLKALQAVAALAAAQALADAHAAENKVRAETAGGARAAALAESAHHLRAAADALGRAEGGLNTALQALEHAGIHGDRSACALKKVTS